MITNKVSELITKFCGFTVLLLGVSFIMVLLFHKTALLQLMSAYGSLKFPASFGFILSGLGLIACANHKDSLILLCGILLSIISSFTLLEYGFGVDLGIDQLFMKSYAAKDTVHAGRMSPFTSWGLLFISILFLSHNLSMKKKSYFIIRLSAVLIFIVGVVPLAGYSVGVETAYSLDPFTVMTMQAAVVFILIGIGATAHVWRDESQKSNTNHAAWISVFVFSIVFLFSIAVWKQSMQREDSRTKAHLQEQATLIQHHILDEVNYSVIALHRMALRWGGNDGTSQNVWRYDAQNYIADVYALSMIGWMDHHYQVKWLEPQVKNQYLYHRYFDVSEKNKLLIKSHHQFNIIFSLPLNFISNQRIVMVFVPIYVQKQFEGLIVGAYNIERLMNQVLTFDTNKLLYVHLKIGDNLVYPLESKHQFTKDAVSISFPLYNQKWTLIVEPDNKFFEQNYSFLPYLELISGIVLSLLLGSTLYYALTAARRNKLLIEQSKALALSEKRQQQLVGDIHDYAIFWLDLKGNVETWNRGAERIYGYSPAEIINRNFFVFYTLQEQKDELPLKIINLAITSGKFEGEWESIRKDKTSFWAFGIIEALKNTAGELAGFAMIVRDVTERKKAEHAQELLISKLVNSNMELEHFADIASHDMQEPLRIIINFSDLLMKDHQKQLGDDARKYLSVIVDSGRRMQDMIQDLLEYSRLSNEVKLFKPVDGMLALEQALANIRLTIEESKAQITFEPLPDFFGNPIQFMRLLQNLIVNGIKYQAKDSIPRIHIGIQDRGAEWCISVQDNGLGIPAEFTEQIFQPFRRLHTWSAIKGTGFGLAICKKIVEHHGGKIWVEPAPERGSIFYFTIPK